MVVRPPLVSHSNSSVKLVKMSCEVGMAFPPRFGRNDNSEYPPNRLNGQSPYFIGKAKKPRREGEGAPTVCRVPGLGGSNTDMAGDEIYIDDMESDSEVQFLSRKKAVPTSINNSKGMAFDFGDDPKLASVRKGILEIVDPDGSRKDSAALMSTIAASTSRSMDLVNGKKEKRPKPLQRKGLASMDDFRMANGAPVVKEMKQVVPRSADNSDESQSDTGYYSGALPKRRVPSFTAPVSTSGLIKKGLAAMNMGVAGGSKGLVPEEQLTGLLAEPSLKHFDHNIINLIESEIMSVTTETGWSDVAGLDGAKKALREIVVLPFKRPDVFKGIRAPPKGVLLFGPPGTGKTMIGKCVASQCQATFFNISASSLTSKWVGEGEKLVRALFAVARIKLPSVIFIDEIDSLLSARSESEHESSRRIKTEFLVQLDGVATNSDERLLVLGATNRPQELDEAARRRFAKRLYIALPESIARLSIVENLLKGMRHNIVDADLTKVAALTDGYSGADMRQLCAEASLGPIRDIENSSTLDIETVDEQDIRPINASDFENAALVVRPTVVDEDLVAYQKWDKKVVMSAPGTPLMGSLPPSSVEGRRVRVLRPVSRPSPSGSPALSGLSQLRTNRPLQSGPPAVEPQPAPLPHMPLTTFAIKALGLIAKLRERIDKQGSMVLSGNEVAHAVREVEKLYNDLEYLAQGFQLRQVDSKSGTNYLNSASQLPDSMTTLNNLTDAFRTDEYLNLASIAWGDQVSRTPYLNVTKNVVSAVKENTELAVIKVKDSHDRFVNSVRFLLTKERELQLRQIKQRMTLHECGFLSHVIEAELGRRNDPPTTFVPLIKATVLVQYGHICIIRLGSLDETLWTADGVVEDSVHEVYRLMSHSATSRLLSTSSAARLQTSSTVTALLAFLQGYTTVFSTPCCSCKKLMRDFLPPTRLLEGSRTAYQHVSCQHLPTNDG